MLVHKRRSGWVYAAALSWRAVLHRFSFALFLTMSLGLLVLGRTQPAMMEKVRVRVVDTVSPALDMVARPLSLVDTMTGRVQSYRSLMEENAKLRTENAALVRWQNAALALENENKELRSLLNYKPEPALSFITARVIADAGGGFLRSLIVTAGEREGVKQGMAAMSGDALVGRVVEVGEWTSRVLLITDMSSRIPVALMGTGDHAILTGDNSARPKLLYLPQEANVSVGTRVMTSGHGGVFPPNVPVGVVTEATIGGDYEVTPLAAMGRMSQVRLIDFQLAGGAVNPIAARIQGATQPKR